MDYQWFFFGEWHSFVLITECIDMNTKHNQNSFLNGKVWYTFQSLASLTIAYIRPLWGRQLGTLESCLTHSGHDHPDARSMIKMCLHHPSSVNIKIVIYLMIVLMLDSIIIIILLKITIELNCTLFNGYISIIMVKQSNCTGRLDKKNKSYKTVQGVIVHWLVSAR